MTLTPRVFISYSWTSPEYEARVVKLAEALVADGVDVILDKWNLRPGQDAYQYMESAVNDPTIEKVLILCDPRYAAKANERQAGVGTETLIMSPEVYREARQEKFVPVIMVRDEDGRVVVPPYLEGRFYVDLSSTDTEADQYIQLVRLIHGKPMYVRPPLGAPPAYLESTAPILRTGRAATQYRDAVMRGQPTVGYLLRDYLDRLTAAFAEELIGDRESAEEILTAVQASLDRFLPYRDEFVGLVRFLAGADHGIAPYQQLHRFFEVLVSFRLSAPQTQWDRDARTENLSFIERELFLHAIAVLLDEERVSELLVLLAPYHVRTEDNSSGLTVAFGVHDPGFRQLGTRSGRRISTIPQLVAARVNGIAAPLSILLDAEFMLSLRSKLELLRDSSQDRSRYFWSPQSAHRHWDAQQSQFAAKIRGGRTDLVRLLAGTSEELRLLVKRLPSAVEMPEPTWLSSMWAARLLGIEA